MAVSLMTERLMHDKALQDIPDWGARFFDLNSAGYTHLTRWH